MGWTMAATHDEISEISELSAWFEEKMLENCKLFFSIAFQILGQIQESEEAVQDASLKAWSQLGKLHDRSAIVGWMARITRNAALDRKKRRVPETVEEHVLDNGAACQQPQTETERSDDRAAIVTEIGQLPEGQAVVVTLRFFEGLDVRAIARRLGLKENAVRVRLHRGLENLSQRPRLQEMSGAES
jgi:RNA polymerase sigma-70 factor, ECF subfamily